MSSERASERRQPTSVFHILMIVSAAVRRMVSSGEKAMQDIGSECSRKILSGVKPFCESLTFVSSSSLPSRPSTTHRHVPQNSRLISSRCCEPLAIMRELESPDLILMIAQYMSRDGREGGSVTLAVGEEGDGYLA